MARRRLRWKFWSAVLLALLSVIVGALPAHAQPPASNPSQMCGTGETFTVPLPGTTLGIGNTSGFWRNIDVPLIAREDSVTLPKGCRIYAFLISGFGDNKDYDRIIFYKVAEFVAQNNGYVHVGWWNNLTAPYMERPLHAETITIQKFVPFLNIPIGDPVTIFPTPQTEGVPDAFVNPILDLPKANPDEDYQFLSDAERVLKAVRTHNPNALILVVGHSMGGNAVARLGATAGIPIDLLAPIDPVGNRDAPVAGVGDTKFNWTRWRATVNWRGYKQWDCVRNSNGHCADTDNNPFTITFACTTNTTPWLADPPLIGSRAPFICPRSYYTDPGTRLSIGSNVKHLYHRWQHEFLWPVDYNGTQYFNRPSTFPRSSTNILSKNYQAPVLEQTLLPDPNRTCAVGVDPRDSTYLCNATEGHGEIIGVRANLLGQRVRPGLELNDWRPRSDITFTPGDRRERLIQLAVDGAAWPYRPQNPDLCLVCDDIITITQHLMSQQPQETEEDGVAPDSTVTQDPDANDNGWVNQDVIVSVTATDDRSGVQEINVALSGAQAGSTITQGSSAQATINAEGLTTVSYFARDQAGNAEAAQTVDVRIDKTPPEIAALTDIPVNGAGWIGAPVVVSFPASDTPGGSGLASSSPDLTISTEGTAQEVTGEAEDNAGNVSTASITLNLDLTAPDIALDSRAPAANAAGWNNSPVTVNWNCTDAVSGVVAGSHTATVSSEGAAQSVLGTCHDNAGHVATDTVSGISVDSTAPGITLQGHAPAPNAAGWNNTDVTVTWNCSDALSGPVAGQVSGAVSAEGAAQNVSGQCVDRADNAASNTRSVNIDKTGPIAQIISPPEGAVYMVNAVVNAAYGCTDALSGVSTCVGPVASGAAVDTATVGDKNFTVNAADAAGNSGATSRSYVVRYAFSGFLNPVAAMPAINSAKAGRTVPIKYTLRDANGALISDLGSFVSLASVPVACDTNVPGAEAEEIDAAGSTAIRFETDKFVFNWQTSSAWEGSCRVLQLNLSDGTQRMVTFQFK
jgi:pimeloyl-ACP methyl ester carboxylesterase